MSTRKESNTVVKSELFVYRCILSSVAIVLEREWSVDAKQNSASIEPTIFDGVRTIE